jgi:hypothetical protein
MARGRALIADEFVIALALDADDYGVCGSSAGALWGGVVFCSWRGRFPVASRFFVRCHRPRYRPGALQGFAQWLEEIGFDEILRERARARLRPPRPRRLEAAQPDDPGATGALYDHTFPFFEPLVAFGFLAAATSRLRFGQLGAGPRQGASIPFRCSADPHLDRRCVRQGDGTGGPARRRVVPGRAPRSGRAG